ncbi:hypothetical protein [Streptomyces boncukensis]|uniref:Uncharacterized protein n=1 Tax=Streptomyces boncukensis TaxID=2711219 RepID=A0A6G4X026_9ACTN|nr:hypothetical protein [Streptomyces boncukensis]NGO70845.1 hypothetical protein [Streptomyces boncukensis]
MGQDRTLARGARVFGALLIAVLALLSLGWIIRDFTKADEVTDVWWSWSGIPARSEDGVWTTSFTEPTLLLMYAVAAVTAARSSSAAAILAGTGTVTVLLRLPGLWNLNADWLQGISEGLKSKVLLSTSTMVVLGLVLVITAIAGRRPAGALPGGYGPGGGYGYGSAYGYGGPPADPAEEPPAGPTRGGGITAFVLLAAAAGVLAAWEIYWWQERGWDVYKHTLTGERSLVALLDVPGGWYSWALAAVALVAAVAALAGAPFSRPLGLMAGTLVAATGLFRVSSAWKLKLFERFDDLETVRQLNVATGLFALVVGLCVLLALSHGERRPARPTVPL